MVVCLVHADLHQNHVISQLCHVTSTNIVVRSIDKESITSGRDGACGLCSITHQRKSGKILRKVSCQVCYQSQSVMSFKRSVDCQFPHGYPYFVNTQ